MFQARNASRLVRQALHALVPRAEGSLMASIQKVPGKRFTDGRDRYRAQYRDSTGRQVVRQFKTRRDAQAWLDQTTHDRVAGVLPDAKAGRQTLQELYDEVHAARQFAPKTVETHTAVWKHVPEGVRRAPISAIDAPAVDRVLARVKAPASRDKLRAVLSMLFSWAIAKRRVKVNPAKRSSVKSTRAERLATASGKDEKRYLTVEELNRLVSEIPAEYRAMVRLMAHVGLRPGEAYALTVGQFGTDRTLRIDRSITGPTKTGETRSIKLPAVVAELVVEHVEAHVPARWDNPAALMFGKIDPNNWRRRVFAPAARRAQLNRGLRVNDLRHTAVAFAIGHGASVYDVQRMVGHAKPSVTLDVYGALWDAGADMLAERLDEAIRDALPSG
jgi:integrase